MNKHGRLVKLGLDTNPVHAARLIKDYADSGFPNVLSHAHRLFDQVPRRDTVLWSSLISAYARSNHPTNALRVFLLMLRQPDSTIRPNHFVFATVARVIASSPEHLRLGRNVHAHITKSGFIPGNFVVETALVDMYSKCHVTECARLLFDEMPHRNLVTWNAMISGYVQNGIENHGLNLFYSMKCREFYKPDEFTIATVLSCCASIQDLTMGIQVHGYAIVTGYEPICLNSISNMYFYCNQVSCAERALNGVQFDVVSKLLMIRGYVFNERFNDALKYISSEEFIVQIFYSDHTIIVPVLTACAKLSSLNLGKQVHCLLITLLNSLSNYSSKEDDGAIIGTALIDMYSKCSRTDDAQKVFDDQHISHWNSMISGYIHNRLIEEAMKLFESMPEKNVVSCTSMISGYLQNNMANKGLNLLSKMHLIDDGFGLEANCFTFVVGLEACSHLTDFERGKQIHSKLIRKLTNDDTNNVIIGTALIDMYSKSGHLNYARIVFDKMLEKNVFAWTSIIMGYAIHGFGLEAIEMFEGMIEEGEKPNEITVLAVLTACSHSGLIDEGVKCFKEMKEKHGLVYREDHYTCLVDMLGRVGRLEDALILVEEVEDGGGGDGWFWEAVLGGCRLYGELEMARRIGKKMIEKKKRKKGSVFITLANVYASMEMWEEAYAVREMWRREGCFDGEPGISRVCTFHGGS